MFNRPCNPLCRVAPVVLLLVLAAASSSVDAFAGVVPTKLIWPVHSTRRRRADHGRRPSSSSSSALDALSHQVNEARRKDLLSRDGSHFKLDRLSGSIEFGATANLVTRLDNNEFRPRNGIAAAAADVVSDHDEAIAEWLRDERGMAFSIWDPKLTTHRGNNIYRLQVMTLQFVTLQLAPWVDVQMKTVLANNNQNEPVFTLQSISYDPNLQLLPGVSVNADTLGITIEVVGQMRPSSTTAPGRPQPSGVAGAIAFQTTGTLPAPMRLLPEPVLKAATDTINQTVVNFAVRSFQKGARKNYRDFLVARALQRQKQKAAAAEAAVEAEAEAASAAETEES